ncbi:hypothetical protein [Luteolibacter sp. AS25]|uniref:hypothetical protein n=1 Tax=Luteolibacter sp. AS25 TaxID=3135776 RepID=UPI00398B6088
MMFKPEEWEKRLERTSALAVVPKESFSAWISEIAPSHPLKWAAERILKSREPVVWIISSTGTFDSSAHFDEFVDGLKRGLMISEFREVTADESLWPPLTNSTFAEYFNLQIFDHVASSGYLVTK